MVSTNRKFNGKSYHKYTTFTKKRDAKTWVKKQPSTTLTRTIKHKKGYTVYFRGKR